MIARYAVNAVADHPPPCQQGHRRQNSQRVLNGAQQIRASREPERTASDRSVRRRVAFVCGCTHAKERQHPGENDGLGSIATPVHGQARYAPLLDPPRTPRQRDDGRPSLSNHRVRAALRPRAPVAARVVLGTCSQHSAYLSDASCAADDSADHPPIRKRRARGGIMLAFGQQFACKT